MTDNPEKPKEEEYSMEFMLDVYSSLMRSHKREHSPALLSQKHVNDLLQEAYDLFMENKQSHNKEAGERINEAIAIIKRDNIKPNYRDWCTVFKMQMMVGDFYNPVCNHAGIKGSKLVTMWNDKHPRDVNFVMAAIFSGFEGILFNGYANMYYSIAKTGGTRNPYFRQNSIRLWGTYLPYHVVRAAICREVPGSIYTKSEDEDGHQIRYGMQGFPRVWSYYTWEDFKRQYANLFSLFKTENERELESSDIVVEALTQPNRFHGLKLMDPEECPVLKQWIDSLPDHHKSIIDAFNQAQWVKIEDAEESHQIKGI